MRTVRSLPDLALSSQTAWFAASARAATVFESTKNNRQTADCRLIQLPKTFKRAVAFTRAGELKRAARMETTP
jgi:hypothetical protein